MYSTWDGVEVEKSVLYSSNFGVSILECSLPLAFGSSESREKQMVRN